MRNLSSTLGQAVVSFGALGLSAVALYVLASGGNDRDSFSPKALTLPPREERPTRVTTPALSLPPAPAFFVVASEDERLTLVAQLRDEAAIRRVLHEPTRSVFIAVAPSDAEAETLRETVADQSSWALSPGAGTMAFVDLRAGALLVKHSPSP